MLPCLFLVVAPVSAAAWQPLFTAPQLTTDLSGGMILHECRSFVGVEA
jgi:hypothetical protein